MSYNANSNEMFDDFEEIRENPTFHKKMNKY